MQKARPAIGRFGSHEAITEYAKTHFGALKRAVIPTGAKASTPPGGMVLHFANGEREMLSRADAEALLNDGILSRLAIRVELG